MMYLKEFNLTEDDLKEIYNALSDVDWQYITTTEVQIEKLLKYMLSIGIKNIKDIFLYRSNVLYETDMEMKKAIEESTIPNLIELINEDVDNFELIGL